MTVHTYSSAAGFLADVQDALEINEDANSLMLGIATRLTKYPPGTPPYLAAVRDGSELVAAALMTPPYDMQICGENADNREALQLIAHHIREGIGSIPGVVGRPHIAQAFAEIYAALNNVTFAENVRMRLYRLDELIPPDPIPGEFRVATEKDIDLLAGWCEAFDREAVPGDPPSDGHLVATGLVAKGDIFVWDDGGAVSSAVRSRPTRNCCTISRVYTPPEFRGRGYAAACTAALSRYLLGTFQFCTLFTDLANPTSNGIYQRIGYRPVCDFTKYRFHAISP